ncbi:CWF19-like protein 2 [Hylaeus volcanicus]|uniref:CWF19-like protein 2 n=1 Tax=Hylaeus volcanicus TaxID=313075 RepID=UPI0023B7E051|nr:CWF19-like protein 2 [Hylaeus volcanicus]
MKHKKEKSKSKHEKHKSGKKNKKHRKQKKYNESSSSSTGSEDEQEWVEKSVSQSVSTEKNIPIPTTQKEPCEREDWMNIKSVFPCVFNKDKSSSSTINKNAGKPDLDKLGQSDRELNPYWRHGGNGLPSSSSIKTNIKQTASVDWLRKSLKRAQEQAEHEGRSLEEIAAERWGSLEVIQSMISEAERGSEKQISENIAYNNKRFKSQSHLRQNKRYRDFRSTSKSQDRNEHRNEYRSHDDLKYEKWPKQKYKKPIDDDCVVSTSHKTHSSAVKKWQRPKMSDKIEKNELDSNASEIKAIDTQNNSNINYSESEETKSLTKAEMNKLGAKIVKAEIMGNTKLADELKIQLKKATELATKTMQSDETEKVQNVILTQTDVKGNTRPLESRSQSTESTKRTKHKPQQTHESGKRVRHYFDDDKYSLQQLFQREKGRSVNEDDAAFVKLASKNMDMDDIFEEKITHVKSDAKQDERDRSLAIKEHKRLSKSLDNCRWCIDSKYMLKHMIVAMDSEICLSLPNYISLTEGHCIITPIQHVASQLQLDENVWEKLKVLKRALYKMFVDLNQYPVFYEIYKTRHKFSHMQLECVPLPKEIGESAPMYFKKALLECETEWSMNKKIIDLEHKDVRRSVPNGLSYFMVEFETDKGYAHVIEDEQMFPNNFAEEVIGGMLDLDHDVWRKPKKETFDQQRQKVLKFLEIWKNYDCGITNCA